MLSASLEEQMNYFGVSHQRQRRRSRRGYILLLIVVLTLGLSGQEPSNLPSNQQVLAFLTESIDWYRHRAVEQQIATDGRDLVFAEDNRPVAGQIVRLSLDFAKTYASIAMVSAGNVKASNSSADLAHFVQLQNNIDLAGKQASQQIEEIKKNLPMARKAERRRLQAALEATQSRVAVLQSASATIQQLVDFVRDFGDGETGDLVSTIDDLARAVPDATNPPGTEPQTQRSELSLAAKPGNSGILALHLDLLALGRKLRIVDDQIFRTDKLRQASVALHTTLLAAINQRFVLDTTNPLQVGDLHALQAQKDQLDHIAASVKTLSPAIVALDKQRILLDAYQAHLKNWRAAVVNEDEKTWKNLVIRLAVLVLITVALLVIGALARRTIRRHVHDSDRRHILLMIQRVFVWGALVLVGAFFFASDFGSFATFFGLVTAGVAVALQSVILCALGHVVLVGKLGIRTGDRVRISGVTGDVIEIGWLQFQLRPVNTETQQPSDELVTFSNSFIFSSPGTGLSRFDRNHLSQAQLDKAAKVAQL
jgi:ABC-type glycerol-3-phosphate transport system permease component/polyhydroxyalkanoate synthesis regulator phasin